MGSPQSSDPAYPARWEIRVRWFLFGAVVGYVLGMLLPGTAIRVGSSLVSAGATRTQIVTIYDTVVREGMTLTAHEVTARVRVERAPAVRYIDSSRAERDTLVAPPFMAEADTVVGRDTIAQRFDFPPPRLSVVVRHGPDSVVKQRDVITIAQEIEVSSPWYIEMGKAAAFLGLGYLGGRLSAP